FDYIITDEVSGTHRWSAEVKPLLEKGFAGQRNRNCGTWTAFLTRFAAAMSAAQMDVLEPLFAKHSIRKTVPTSFTGEVDAVTDCAHWLRNADDRIMVVTGSPGAGKSVFALSLAEHVYKLFRRDPQHYPAPFLVWFSTDRPARLEDLITVTLDDAKIDDL